MSSRVINQNATMRVTANSSSPIPILTYHQIDLAPAKGAAFRSLYVTPASFARQMAMLKVLGYQGLCMSALLPYLTGDRVGKVIGITFDDGYLNNLAHALPVLNRHGFSATCYVVSQKIGLTNVWDQVSGVAQSPLMNAQQLRQWVAGGQEIGAHTRNHVHLAQADALTQRQEIIVCKAELEEVLGTTVNHFCYPYGQFDDQCVALAVDAGYATATTSRRGRCSSGESLALLPRVPVVRSTTLPVFWLKLATAYEDRHE